MTRLLDKPLPVFAGILAIALSVPQYQEGGGHLDSRSALETGAVIGTPAVPVKASGLTSLSLSAPAPTGEIGTALVGGWASWYDDGPGRYAAAGPLIRKAIPHWRGKTLLVTSGKLSTLVKLVDFCGCGDRADWPTLLDLSPAAFQDLAPLSQGIVFIEVELVTLPATDSVP